MDRCTIGEVAKRAHVGIETLRYYERMGLVVPPPRNGSLYRLYPKETVRRVQCMKRAHQLGFSPKEMTARLALRATPDTPCGDIRTRAFAKINDIAAQMRALQARKRALTHLVEECPGEGEMTDCPMLASLDTAGTAHNGQELTRATKRTLEMFSAGCPACEETVTLLNRIACPSCEVTV
jgi:MerR family copper efflux transcriptional regulator